MADAAAEHGPEPGQGREEPQEPTGAVRARVVVLAADVLPALGQVPPRLRRIAEFAPARRARLGGEQVLAAIQADDDLRVRVAALVTARTAERAGDADEAGDDPVGQAALAWLERGPQWRETWRAAHERLAERAELEDAAREEQDVVRAEKRAERAEAALKDLRIERRRQVDELRGEVGVVRRRLGETRARERDTRRELQEAREQLEAVRREAQGTAADGEAERRRPRARVEELEAANAALRRADRSGRDEAGLRVRVLLDSVAEAAAGLRRELALPAADGSPADRVERLVAARAAGAAGTVAAREGATALEQYLAAPRARLLVDGYNVSKTAWSEATLEDQRTRLLRSLAPLVARTGAETTVVFDAAASRAHPVVPAPRGVRVLFSPYGVIADDVIAELVELEPEGRMVVVVSSDGEVTRHAARYAGRPVASATLLSLLA